MYESGQEKLKPIGVLMMEHRLIEKALDELESKIEGEMVKADFDALRLAELIDFFGTYADDTHHGKEEDILFVEAAGAIGDELNKVMEELREDHVRFRGFRADMARANRKIADGDQDGYKELVMTANMFVPRLRDHIKKEDDVFFRGFDLLQSPEERASMKESFKRFDMEMVHKKYGKVINGDKP